MVPVASCPAVHPVRLRCSISSAWDDPTFQWIVFPEAVLMPATLIIVAAFAAILGMQMSLRPSAARWRRS